MISVSWLAAVAAGTFCVAPTAAQHHQHTPGMAMPAPAPATAPTPPHSQAHDPAPEAAEVGPHQHRPGMTMPPATPKPMPMPAHRGHDHAAMAASQMRMNDWGANYGSGTSLLPRISPMMMGPMFRVGGFDLMAHGYLWGVATDQSGPRGDQQAFVQSMAMVTADRDLSPTTHLQLRTMLSVEPLMGRRGYPNLLATGETAFGEGLIDRQHPHDLFMELAARIDVAVAARTRVFVYGGPVGEPALGPSAFMHRPSARYLPLGPIGHHWFDSAHITYGVVTAGVRSGTLQFEASAFRGREPDEERWNIEAPKLDSWSVRASWLPSENWAAQVSHGRLTSPEALHPDEDEARTTASVHYSRGGFDMTIAFSAKNRLPGPTLTAWLAEANYGITPRHQLFGRVENLRNDELIPEGAAGHGNAYRVSRFEGGYGYRIPLPATASLTLGGSLFAVQTPREIAPLYDRPIGMTLFAKLTLGQ